MEKQRMKKILSILIIAISVIANADTMSILLENDTLSLPKKDSEYTHGTEIKWMAEDPLWIFDDYGLSIQQNMYGPKLDKTDRMIHGEHPYCGYLSFNLIGEQWFDDLSLNHQLGLGGVGPHTYAEETQKYIHKILGCKEPKGWKKWQIRDEFIVQYQLYANYNWEIFRTKSFNGYLIPRTGVDVGGFKDMIATGIDFKFGFNTPKNSGSGMILSAPAKVDKSSDWNLFLLAGVEGRYVFHDTSIEGGFFRDSPYTLDAEPWVGEFHWGVGFEYGRLGISYYNFIRSKEFETNYRKPNYGQLKISFSF